MKILCFPILRGQKNFAPGNGGGGGGGGGGGVWQKRQERWGSISPEILCINILAAKTTQRQAVAELVSERCKINCIANNKPLKLLLKSWT